MQRRAGARRIFARLTLESGRAAGGGKSSAAIHQNKSLPHRRDLRGAGGTVRLAGSCWHRGCCVPRCWRTSQDAGVKPTVARSTSIPFVPGEVKDFSLAAPGGDKLLGFGRLFIDFELSSIWHRAYTFSNIDIDAPSINAVWRATAISIFYSCARRPRRRRRRRRRRRAVAGVAHRVVQRQPGTVAYEDRSRPSAFTARLEPINFQLVNFTTGVDGGRFTLTGSSKLGERLTWRGHVSCSPSSPTAKFRSTDCARTRSGNISRTVWDS